MKKHKTDTYVGSELMFLKGQKTTLRPLLEKDIPLLMRWINDPEIRPFLTGVFPVTEGIEREWFERMNKKSETDVVLVIEVKGKPIGVMGIHHIDWRNRVATTGAVIGEKAYWDKGYGTDAKMALLDYAFNTLNLRKIISRVKEFNLRSVAYSEKCGYKIEGKLKDQFVVEGGYRDEIIMGLFKEDWIPHWNDHRGLIKMKNK